jgi:hypothetical protein
MTRIKCCSVDDNGVIDGVKCKGGGFGDCTNVEVKNGIFHYPYPYDRSLNFKMYCSIVGKDTIWIEYGLEEVMKEIIKKEEKK